MERSSYYDYRSRKKKINVQRVKLKALVNRIFTEARSSVGSRGIRSILADEGIDAGRYLIRRLIKESGLVSGRRYGLVCSSCHWLGNVRKSRSRVGDKGAR